MTAHLLSHENRAVTDRAYSGNSLSSSVPSVEVVQGNFPAQGIPMEPQQFCSVALITVGFFKSRLYEFLFELTDRFFEINAFFNHFGNQLVQLLSHESTF